MSSTNQPVSTNRIITQNLVISAVQAETAKQVWESSVRDLSTLINLVALYDEAFLLARGSGFYQGPKTDLMAFLSNERIIKTQALDKQTCEKVSQIAQKHLAFYLGEDKVEKFDSLLRFALSPEETFYGLVYFPDTVEDVRVGDLWLRTVPETANLIEALEKDSYSTRGTTFLVRTFLYLAYSDFLKIPFTVDSARSTVVSKVIDKEDMFFRSRIVKTLQDQYEKYPSILVSEPNRIVSPFAAIVFDRCNGKRSNLVKEIQKIRDELKPTRERLRELENKALSGSWSESKEIVGKINSVLNEIVQSFGPRPGLLSWKQGISLAKETADIIDKPFSWKAWLTGLLSLPVDMALRLASRRPVAEIHELKQALPGPQALDKSLYDLFGFLQSEKTS